MKEKVCCRCNETKSTDAFYKYPRSKDGLAYHCRDCQKAYRQSEKGRAITRRAMKKGLLDGSIVAANRDRRGRDIQYSIKIRLRDRMYHALRGKVKSDKTSKLLGCSIDELIRHIESQFTEGMTWENRGEWHIDHIIPCAKFDLVKSEQQRICFNWRNLQPLWAEENRIKSDNYEGIVPQTIGELELIIKKRKK